MVNVEIAGAELVRDADSAILEPAVPDVPVERVEALDADGGLRAAVEAAAEHRGLGDAVPLPCLDTELHVLEDHVGAFIGCGKGRAVLDGSLRLPARRRA